MRKQIVSASVVFCSVLFSCTSDMVSTANFQIVPLPQEITTTGTEKFVLNKKTQIVYPKGNDVMKQNAGFLAEYIQQKTKLQLNITDNPQSSNAIILQTGLNNENTEAYQLAVTKEGITVTGASEAGAFYGIQTIRKAIPVTDKNSVSFPATLINDYPRFSYRGAHLDVARHFFPADSIKRFVDMLALHNINRLHWHISDDQGWRIEIKKRPGLTEKTSQRAETVIGHNTGKYDNTPYGGFYTQEDAKEIVRYAKERHITVIPEIDMPGHMQCALTAYPELGCTGGPYEVWKMWGVSEEVLCAGNDKTYQFIDDVLEEIVEIFPSEYINVGGDECPKVRWEKCPKCQAKIKELGIKAEPKHTAEEKLQSHIISYAEQFLNKKGRQIIGWDEILEGGLAPNATVLSWRGIEGGIEAARQKHNAIMSPTSFLYFDYYQTKDIENEPMAIGGYVPIEKVYSFEPVPDVLTPEEAKYIIGVQANLWTEYIKTYNQVEYMELPRMAALSEVQWTMPEKKDYQNFMQRLPQLVQIYDLMHYNYAKHIFGVSVKFIPNYEQNVLDVVLSTIDTAPIYYTLDGTAPTSQSMIYTDTLKINQNCVLKAVAIRETGNSSVFTEEILFNKASMKPITLLQPINKQYEFEGASTLIDGLKGNNNYKTGRWIAFYKNDLEAVIDLQTPTEISSASFSTCVEKGDWVFDARGFIVAVSENGTDFREIASEKYPAMTEEDRNGVYNHALSFLPTTTRYVKIKALTEHQIPQWHGGKGKNAFLFIDEISIK